MRKSIKLQKGHPQHQKLTLGLAMKSFKFLGSLVKKYSGLGAPVSRIAEKGRYFPPSILKQVRRIVR
jgi:hypothetical protein